VCNKTQAKACGYHFRDLLKFRSNKLTNGGWCNEKYFSGKHNRKQYLKDYLGIKKNMKTIVRRGKW